MKALILAAGRGKRLRPFTDTTPKPLLPVRGHRLCDWSLCALKKAGVTEIVMNTAHLAHSFDPLPTELAAEGFHLTLSREGEKDTDALESLGGIVKALPLLTDGAEPFLVLAGDVVHNYPLERLAGEKAEQIRRGVIDAHLVAVPNPAYHPQGDMTVGESGRVVPGPGPHTYGCLMVVSPRIFSGCRAVPARLFPWLWQFAATGRLTAEVFAGFWGNIGDPEQYQALIDNEEAQRWAQL